MFVANDDDDERLLIRRANFADVGEYVNLPSAN